jgi:hypothetical protein
METRSALMAVSFMTDVSVAAADQSTGWRQHREPLLCHGRLSLSLNPQARLL